MALYSPEHLEAIRADEDWRAELRKQFGRRANRVRFTAEGRGVAQSPLRELYTSAQKALHDWHASMGFGSDD
jgi:hypothetical protein